MTELYNISYGIKTEPESSVLKALEEPEKCDFTKLTSKGNSILIFALHHQMCDVAMRLLDFPDKCFLNHMNNNKNTALLMACIKRCDRVAMKILQFHDKCNINAITTSGNSALIHACRYKMTNVALEILKYQDESILGIQGDYGTPLYIACRNNLTEIVSKILEKPNKCRMNAVHDGNTPLIYCIMNNLEGIAMELLKYPDYCGLDYVSGSTPLMLAIGANSLDVTLEILKYPEQCKLNYITKNGGSALSRAIERGNTNIIFKILDHHKYITKTDYHPFRIARADKRIDVIVKLIALGFSPNKEINDDDMFNQVLDRLPIKDKIKWCYLMNKYDQADKLLNINTDEVISQLDITFNLMKVLKENNNEICKKYQCLICYDDNVDSYLMRPCKHIISLDSVCAKTFTDKCLICRQNVQSMEKVFIM